MRAISASADGEHAISGSFDTLAIVWSLTLNKAERVLRFHEGAVNAVTFLGDGRMATAGEDARIAIWRPGEDNPVKVLAGHQGPIVALTASPDGTWLASAAWDRTARLWPLNGGEPRVLEGHQQNVNGVAFMPDGRALVTIGYDASLRIWPIAAEGAPTIINFPAPLNSVAIAADGEIVTSAANGAVYFLSAAGKRSGEVEGTDVPVITLALAPNGRWIAAAGSRGVVMIIDRSSHEIARTLVAPGISVWSTSFLPDNTTLLTGGSDGAVRRWNVVSGKPTGAVAEALTHDPLAAFGDDSGAQMFRACVACHTLTGDDGNRAGPSLRGIFGRRIATLPGYNFSPALTKLDIIWTAETLSKLFEIGPTAYTPGTKMPEQRINSPENRAALVEFLRKATSRH